jgi:hypothetical protein
LPILALVRPLSNKIFGQQTPSTIRKSAQKPSKTSKNPHFTPFSPWEIHLLREPRTPPTRGRTGRNRRHP